MDKKHEVEYRIIINEDVFAKFHKLGFESFKSSFYGPIIIEDVYFCSKDASSFSEIEMDKIGSYGLRLRRETVGAVSQTTLNAKILTKENDHRSGLEHETIVASFEESKGILDLIGFKPFFTIKKDRYTYSDNGINVCLEKIENFDPIMELEIVTSEDKIEEARERLLILIDSYNIPRTAIVEKSITNMLMRERAVF